MGWNEEVGVGGVMKKRAVRRGERVFEITICPYWLYILNSYSQWAIYSQFLFYWLCILKFISLGLVGECFYRLEIVRGVFVDCRLAEVCVAVGENH